MAHKTTGLHGGISGVELEPERFDLGEGVFLQRTYAHLTAPNIMAFARPKNEGQAHPGPWRAARGGSSYDITVELHVPLRSPLEPHLDAQETIWWIASLIRLAQHPFLSVPVVSDTPFSEAATRTVEPLLTPFEVESRMFAGAEGNLVLKTETLEWVRDHWITSAKTLIPNQKFELAFRAFDDATLQSRSATALLTLWGSIEQLFSPSKSELRYRVASLMAAYLTRPGPARLQLYRDLLKLYDARSTAAHTAKSVEGGDVVGTYVPLRNAFLRMITEGTVPTRAVLEAELFGC